MGYRLPPHLKREDYLRIVATSHWSAKKRKRARELLLDEYRALLAKQQATADAMFDRLVQESKKPPEGGSLWSFLRLRPSAPRPTDRRS